MLYIVLWLVLFLHADGACTFHIGSVVADGEGSWDIVQDCLKFENYKALRQEHLIISNTGSTSPPADLLTSAANGNDVRTKVLVISNSYGLTKFPDDFFLGMNSVKELVLGNLDINFLGSRSFAGLDRLEALYLNGNHLRSLYTENGVFDEIPSLSYLNVEGNPLEQSCLPTGIEVIPPDVLPFCDGYTEFLQEQRQKAHVYKLWHLIDPLFENFPCFEQPEFLANNLKRAYKVGAGNVHYGLVFMLENGFMISELTNRDSTIAGETHKSIHIKSTCIAVDMASIRGQLLEHFPEHLLDYQYSLFVEVLFALRTAVWRHTSDDRLGITTGQQVNVLSKIRAIGDLSSVFIPRVLDVLDVPEDLELLASHIIDFGKEYETEHPVYMTGINSCMTFAHVAFYRIQRLVGE